MSCRYDTQARTHLNDGEPCTHDDSGNPVRHCRTRTRCATHLGWTEHACPGCTGKIRMNLETIVELMALMPEEAIEQRRLDSEAMNLAGPHADHVTSQWRLINADRAGIDVDELDDRDPYTTLTLYERMIREDLGHDETTLVSPDLSSCVGYLTWVLTDLAASKEGAEHLPALLSATAKLRNHLEAARLNGMAVERGAPCPECVESGAGSPRLVKRYGHWCRREDCTRPHFLDDTGDVWRCPKDDEHQWSHADYMALLDTRKKGGSAIRKEVLPSA